MFNESNCYRKSQLSGMLTKPLNPRDVGWDVSVILSYHGLAIQKKYDNHTAKFRFYTK